MTDTPPPTDPPEANTAAGAGCMARIVRRCVTHHFACDCREARFRELLEDVIWKHSDSNSPEYNECDKDPCAWCEEAKALIYHGHPEGKLSSTNDQGEAQPPAK
jgi:hypothetical protein